MTCETCQHTNKPQVTLETGEVVCNFCPKYASECLVREKLAKRLIASGSEGRAEFRAMRDSGVDVTRLTKVIERLNK